MGCKASCWYLLMSALFVLITINAEKYTFVRDQGKLNMCIEDHLSKDPHLKNAKSIKVIANYIAVRLSNKSLPEKQFNKAVENMYYTIKNNKAFLFNDNKVPKQLQASVKEALKNCVDKLNLPIFVHEPRVLADLLDLILVDWPTHLNDMINTHEGRSILRLYAYSTGARLMSALSDCSMNFDLFNRQLQRIWINRAEQYYDGRNNEVPYIRHRFTTDNDRVYSSIPLDDVHTLDDINTFVSRRSEDFQRRNPFFNQWDSNQVMQVLQGGSFSQKNDDLPETVTFRVTGAQYYLETHIDQCYKIIMFVLELQLRGISTDEDDFYSGTIPSAVMPFPIQEIVWNGFAYRNYLVGWRKHLQQFSREELKKCHTREDLIMLLALMIVQKSTNDTLLTTTTTSTTTTTATSSESSNYEEGSKKGGIREGDCGKYFLPNKKFKTMLPDQDEPSKQMDTNYRNYGFIEYVGELNRQILLEKDRLTLPEILNEFFFTEVLCNEK